MSMHELNEGLDIVDANRSRGFFAGPRDPALIAAAETAIGRAFPPTYREFVERLGAGNFGAFEVYGVTNSNFENGKVPNGIWLTLKQRRAGKLPDNLLAIGDTGDGAYYCIELCEWEEGPVVIYQPNIPAQNRHFEQVAKDFGEFLLTQVREQL